ncbi:lisH domain-containing protein FOPNL-like [Actinia tenebrosa]|uniref:Centrosomal protein 20 n=1 Tax=Actinia tenebrosa TaxID=6105 RepID=A0A6P8ILG2_ACTTE|nr:lisH domain-containing protein FOPNL-like [Actinia tenebrosa]
MATAEELKQVLKETLENQGVLGQIRARIRAEVFNALDDQTEPRPTLSNENMLINELIREYLEFNKYKYTQSVFLTETGQPRDPIDRKFLTQELNISEDHATASTPLLYGIMAHFLQGSHKQSRTSRQQQAGPRASPREGYLLRPRRDHLDRSREISDLSDMSDYREPGPLTVKGRHR